MPKTHPPQRDIDAMEALHRLLVEATPGPLVEETHRLMLRSSFSRAYTAGAWQRFSRDKAAAVSEAEA